MQGKTIHAKEINYFQTSKCLKTCREYFLNDEKYLSVPYCGLLPTKNNYRSSAVSVGLCNWHGGDRVELQLKHHLLSFPDLCSPPKKYCFFNIKLKWLNYRADDVFSGDCP